MNNQPWDDVKLDDWKHFWESETGQVYLQKLENTKQIILEAIMNNTDKDTLSHLAGRAAGVTLIIEDIKAGLLAANEKRKEPKPKAKK